VTLWPAASVGLCPCSEGEHSHAASEHLYSKPGRLVYFSTMERIVRLEIKRLNHFQVCIPPGEEQRAREFYGKLLGLEEIPKPEVLRPSGGLWFNIADIQLHIGIEEGQSPSKRHPAFEVENLEQIRAYLTENGVRTKDEHSLPGVDRFSFFDPFGNRIELMERTDVK
jgi:catechol 2,3-dioxygenase-like lactoylglutathione lyase family enzyme